MHTNIHELDFLIILKYYSKYNAIKRKRLRSFLKYLILESFAELFDNST